MRRTDQHDVGLPPPLRRRGGLGRGALPLALLFLIATSFATAQTSNPAYDTIVDAVVARYHLPGIAVGVIENGKVVYIGTRGETVAGSGKKIDADTLFKIASNSKAMTTALLGRLVDQGKLRASAWPRSRKSIRWPRWMTTWTSSSTW